MCDHYTPSDDFGDGYYDYLIESERNKYRADFIEYIGDYNEDLFY